MRCWTRRALLTLLVLVVFVAFGCEKKAEKAEEKAESPAPEQAEPEAEEGESKEAAPEPKKETEPAAEEGPDVPADAAEPSEVAGAEDQEPSAMEEGPKAEKVPAMLLIGAQVLMLDEAGEQMGVLTDMPTLTARFGPDRSSVILLSEGARGLYEIPMTDDEPRLIADLPTSLIFEKETTDYEAGSAIELMDLDLQSASDFWINEGTACIVLMDANINMASLSAVLAIDLASGKMETELTALMEDEEEMPASCAQRPARPEQPSCAHTLNEKSQLIKVATQEVLGTVGYGEDFMLDSVSPTGRWATLQGNLENGDYIYQELFLLNCESGEIFAAQAEGWGEAIARDQLAELEREMTNAITTTGESTVQWMPGLDKLVVDGILIEPGVGTKSFEGELVF